MVIFEEERRRRREVERALGEAGKRLPEASQSHHSIVLPDGDGDGGGSRELDGEGFRGDC